MRTKIAIVVCTGLLLAGGAWGQDGFPGVPGPAGSWGEWVSRVGAWLEDLWPDGAVAVLETAQEKASAGEPAALDGETCTSLDPLRRGCAGDPNG